MIFIIYLHVAGCMWFSVIEGTYRKTLDHAIWCQNIESAYDCKIGELCAVDLSESSYLALSEEELYTNL